MKKKELQCNFFEYEKGNFDGLTTYYKGKNNIYGIALWIKKNKKREETLKTIYHEIGHCLIYIFEHIETDINKHTDEIFLYTQENLTEQIMKILYDN